VRIVSRKEVEVMEGRRTIVVKVWWFWWVLV
jgi:hypothetical protein